MRTPASTRDQKSYTWVTSACAFFRCSGVMNALAPMMEALRESLHLLFGFLPASIIVLVLALFGVHHRYAQQKMHSIRP